jgi:hypothetical protein
VFVLHSLTSLLSNTTHLDSPPRDPCDEEGCDSISVRGTKCKAHAEPSKKCVIGGCRKGAAVGGLCKRHQNEILSTGGIKAVTNKPVPMPNDEDKAATSPAKTETAASPKPAAPAAAAARSTVPMCLPVPTAMAYPPNSLAQMMVQNELLCQAAVAQQHMALGLGMGLAAASPYPYPVFGAPFLGAGLGAGGGMYARRAMMGLDPREARGGLTADAMMMLEMAKRSKGKKAQDCESDA